MEAWAGIEPAIELLQSSALPLGYHAAFTIKRCPLSQGVDRLAKVIPVSSRFSSILKFGLSFWGRVGAFSVSLSSKDL